MFVDEDWRSIYAPHGKGGNCRLRRAGLSRRRRHKQQAFGSRSMRICSPTGWFLIGPAQDDIVAPLTRTLSCTLLRK